MSETADRPPLRHRALRAGLRLYPLKSGCAGLANGRLAGALAPPAPRIVWTRAQGGWMLAPLDDFVGRAAYFFGDLDPKITTLIRRLAHPGDTVLDIGGNLGLVTLCAARAVGPGGAVHVFEPNPAMARHLRRVTDRNAGLPITLHELALGDKDGELTLSIPKGNAGAASLAGDPAGGAIHRVSTRVRRLSDYGREIGLDRIDLIKIDVEGFEADVLEGGADLISDTRPRAIILEEHGFQAARQAGSAAPRSFQILERLGYHIHGIPRALFRVDPVPLEKLGDAPVHDFIALSKTG